MQEEANHGFSTFQEFLDNKQYTRRNIVCYEKIFGKDFVSTGGRDTTAQFVSNLNLQPSQKVLDVGAGIGGSAFYMAKEYGVEVLGIDLSTNMIEMALDKNMQYNDKRVKFQVADATLVDYPAESFDVIYSRDTILHIKDKLNLFKNFLKWLRLGGKLLITDYCCTPDIWSDNYAEYVAGRGYNLLSVQEYGKVLEQAGFSSLVAEDRTDLFVASLQKELTSVKAIKEEFIRELSSQAYVEIETGWKEKLVRCGQGDQRWGYFFAQKAM